MLNNALIDNQREFRSGRSILTNLIVFKQPILDFFVDILISKKYSIKQTI